MTNKMNKKINEEGDVERGSVIDNLFKLIPEFKDVNDFANDDPLYTQENSDESNGELKPEEQKKLFEKLRTRKNFRKQRDSNQLNNSSKRSNISLPILKSERELVLYDHADKAFEKAKIIRETKQNIKRMDFINLFSYKKSKWNQQSLLGNKKDKSPTRIKEKRKASLPDFRVLLKKKITPQITNNQQPKGIVKGDLDLKEIEKEVNENLAKQREKKKEFKSQQIIQKKVVLLSKEETLKKIQNGIKDIQNVNKEIVQDEMNPIRIRTKTRKGISRKQTSIISEYAIK